MTPPDREGALAQRRDLFLNLTRTELTARYKTSTLGVLWFVLTPLLMTLIMTVVFGYVVRLPIERYPVFVLSALLPWTFFQIGLINATSSVTRAPVLVKRMMIPRILIPLAAVAASLVHFAVSLAVLIACIGPLGVSLTPYLLLLPAAVLLEAACVAGLGLLMSGLNVLFRDVEHILTAVLRAVFYVTPTFYPLSYVPERWQPIVLLNPIAGIVEIHRTLILDATLPAPRVVLMSLAVTAVSLAAGVVLFRRLAPDFDDYL